MTALVDYKGAETVKVGVLEVGMNSREALFTYDILTWKLPHGDPISMRLLTEAVLLKHVRQAMLTHPGFDELVIKLGSTDG